MSVQNRVKPLEIRSDILIINFFQAEGDASGDFRSIVIKNAKFVSGFPQPSKPRDLV